MGDPQEGWGINGKLPEVSAAIGLAVLKHFDEVLAHLRAVAQCYIELLRNYDELIFRQDVGDAPWLSFSILLPSSFDTLGWVRNYTARSASVSIANAIRDCIANPSRLQ